MGTRTRALYVKYNIQPDIIVECPDEYSIVALVRESFGIALMPRTDILELAPGVCIHPIENLDIYKKQEEKLNVRKISGQCKRKDTALLNI